jgi:Kef-type K+ transport system membrane component KefB
VLSPGHLSGKLTATQPKQMSGLLLFEQLDCFQPIRGTQARLEYRLLPEQGPLYVAEAQLNAKSQRSVGLTLAVYALMVVAAVAVFLMVRTYGQNLVAPAAAEVSSSTAAAKAAGADALLHVLIALAAVIVVGQVLAKLFVYIHQPPVIGEVVAGILLGPSLLGVQTSELILPQSVAPYLSIIAQFGIILYMFLVGLELNAGLLRRRAQTTFAISQAGIVVPFILGTLISLYLYPRLSSAEVSFTNFALFLGVAMSITAFPVLARILADSGIIRTELGVVAIGCAAIGDVTAWCMLAIVVGVAKAEVDHGIVVVAGAAAYIAAILLIARPLVKKIVLRWSNERLPREAVTIVFVTLLVSAIATEAIGIHAIFGAFLLGAIIPHTSAVARAFTQQLENLVTVLLLPAFFALTGMRTRIDLVSGLDQWLICGLIILVASFGKFGGTITAARFTGVSWRDSAALGTLMNTRGLMELIVLNVGFELKIISPTLYSMMVLMALVTTMATSPILRLLRVRPASAAN